MGKYCGHTLGIEARSYPVVAGKDEEGLFDCSGQTDVLLDTNCACAVTPGAADECVTPPGRRLWIAYETGTTTCVSQLTDFWDCLLSHSSFDDLVLSYGTGYTLGWGGIAQVPSSCGIDYGCATSAAKWSVGPLDVVVIVTAGGVGGQNDWTPSVTVNGKTVPIHGAHIGDASGDCGMQTAYSMHEVYEATTDPGAADCCDGEIPATPPGESGVPRPGTRGARLPAPGGVPAAAAGTAPTASRPCSARTARTPTSASPRRPTSTGSAPTSAWPSPSTDGVPRVARGRRIAVSSAMLPLAGP